MPIFYKNICAYCNKEYRGRRKIYCSNHCASKIENKKKANKLSKALQGKKNRLGISQPEEWKQWQRNRLLRDGSPMKRPEVRAKIIGENNPSWKGGITPLNKLIRGCSEYENWRKEVLKKDNYICQFCRRRGGNLNVDHIKPFSQFPDLRFDISNGRTLCIECHRKGGTYGRKAEMSLL